MLVLGIDPGSVYTGIAWIRGDDKHILDGSHRSMYSTYLKNTERIPIRWGRLRQKLESSFKSFPELPSMVAIEEPFRERNRKPVDHRELQVFFGSYAVAVAEVSRMFPETVLTPVRYMSWTGGLSKEQVLKGLLKKYDRQAFLCEDESDAVGIADFAWEIISSGRRKFLKKKEEENALCRPVGEPENGNDPHHPSTQAKKGSHVALEEMDSCLKEGMQEQEEEPL